MKINLEEMLYKLTEDFDSYKDYSYLSESYIIHFEKEDDKVYLICEDIPIKPQKLVIDGKVEELLKVQKYINNSIDRLTYEGIRIDKNMKGVNGFAR